MNFDALKNALVAALAEAGLNEYEIYYMSDESVSVSTLNKEVNSFASSTSGGLCLRVAVDGKMGYALYTTIFECPDSMNSDLSSSMGAVTSTASISVRGM